MSPQPAAAPPAKPANTPTENVPFTPDGMIQRAKDLERQRGDLQTLIGKNRDLLRLMDANGGLSAEQSTFVKTFYPDKEKGERRSKDEIDASRKLREDARKAATTPAPAAA